MGVYSRFITAKNNFIIPSIQQKCTTVLLTRVQLESCTFNPFNTAIYSAFICAAQPLQRNAPT